MEYNKLLLELYQAIPNIRYNNNFYYQKPIKEDIDQIISNLNDSINKNFDIINSCDCIVFDSAGIGDVVHSRLLVQHLKQKYNNICWLVPPISESLYKDDCLAKVIPCCYIRYRNPNGIIENKLITLIDILLKSKFPGKVLYNIPYNVLKYITKGNHFDTFPQMWFNSNNIKRDRKIKHEINHNGKLEELNIKLRSKYIVLEYCCLARERLSQQVCESFIHIMNSIDIDCVYVGGLDDPKLNNGIDCRGLSLYNTLTLIKNSCGFVGRASGNECLIAFHPVIPVFEVDAQATMSNEEYIDKKFVHQLSSSNFISYIKKYYVCNI